MSFPGTLNELAYSGGVVAWIDNAWTVHTLVLSTGKTTAVSYTNAHGERSDYSRSAPPRLTVAGEHVAWLSTHSASTTDSNDAIYLATIGQTSARRIVRVQHLDGGGGSYLLGIAGDSLGFSYGLVDVQPVNSDQLRFRVTGGVKSFAGSQQSQLPNVPPAIVRARFGGRIAVQPVRSGEQQDGFPIPLPTIEIRDARSGKLIRTVATGPMRAAALTRNNLAVLTNTNIVQYDISTGRRLRSTPVPRDTASELVASPDLLAFRTAHSVKVLNPENGQLRTLAVTNPWYPTGLAFGQHALVWAEERPIAKGGTARKTYTTQLNLLDTT